MLMIASFGVLTLGYLAAATNTSARSAAASGGHATESFAIDASGVPRMPAAHSRAHPELLRSEQQLSNEATGEAPMRSVLYSKVPAHATLHSETMLPAALGEQGDMAISGPSAAALGESLAESLQAVPKALVKGDIYFRQPSEQAGQYKAREWSCDACKLAYGKGNEQSKIGCFTVADMKCSGGEYCLKQGTDCYFGKLEVPPGLKVTMYSGFSDDTWSDACGSLKTKKASASTSTKTEMKTDLWFPGDRICAFKVEVMSDFECDSPPKDNIWKTCNNVSLAELSKSSGERSVLSLLIILVVAMVANVAP